MANENHTRQFSYTTPILYQGAEYPSAPMSIADDKGNIQDRNVFADNKGQYYTVNNEGKAIPIILQHSLPEVVVTAPRENLLSKQFNDYLTMSNDNTMVNNVPHREYNPHLKYSAIQGAKDHVLWEKQHPNATAWGNVAAAIPFAVAAAPFAAGIADYVGGTALGQGITEGLGYMANVAKNSTWLPWADAAASSYFGAKGLQDIQNGTFTPETAMDVLPLAQVAKPIYGAGASLLERGAKEAWYSKWAQYPRYYAGKLYYGNDVELPTLYRKLRNLPTLKDGKIMLTNPNSRLAYMDGTDSPVITNMTTDVPVRSHKKGNWDLADVLAFPGKTLLGKNVISTRPSDTFTFGDNITINPSKVTFFSGLEDRAKAAQNLGMKSMFSEESKRVLDAFNKAKEESTGLMLDKIDKADYSKGIQELTRKTFKSPTLKDYKFMDWVFQPKYKSEVFPYKDLSKIKTLEELQTLPEQIISPLGDARLRPYLLDPNEWRNVIYHPATYAEYEFREGKRIDSKENIFK